MINNDKIIEFPDGREKRGFKKKREMKLPKTGKRSQIFEIYSLKGWERENPTGTPPARKPPKK